MRARSKVVSGGDGSASIGFPALGSRRDLGGFFSSLCDPSIEDDLDIGIILKPLDKVPVQPPMLARHDEHKAHADAILRRSPVQHAQNSSENRPWARGHGRGYEELEPLSL
jgi:hypothetical protein